VTKKKNSILCYAVGIENFQIFLLLEAQECIGVLSYPASPAIFWDAPSKMPIDVKRNGIIKMPTDQEKEMYLMLFSELISVVATENCDKSLFNPHQKYWLNVRYYSQREEAIGALTTDQAYEIMRFKNAN
jgi:hypothetical protein